VTSLPGLAGSGIVYCLTVAATGEGDFLPAGPTVTAVLLLVRWVKPLSARL